MWSPPRRPLPLSKSIEIYATIHCWNLKNKSCNRTFGFQNIWIQIDQHPTFFIIFNLILIVHESFFKNRITFFLLQTKLDRIQTTMKITRWAFSCKLLFENHQMLLTAFCFSMFFIIMQLIDIISCFFQII